MQQKLPKILAPVRDETSFQAALQAGADAVYFGVGELNMRASSQGINLQILQKIISQAHKKNIQVFITLNTIIYNHEIKRLEQILKQIKKAKADAVICWDFAVINFCKKLGIPFHVSTQASISNLESAKFYEKLGAKAIILARECSLDQIAKIRQKIKCKLEIFCHGAMCVSISGRCFLSQFLHCKSANRGECFQPCRQEYLIYSPKYKKNLLLKNNYILSPKDLCTLNILDKIVKTGVDYLKIEGRGRSPEYIYTVTKAYKEALVNLHNLQKMQNKLIREIKKVYNRGFSTGFLFGKPGKQGWAKTSGSQATERKKFIGKITNYFKKIKITEIILNTGNIKTGDLLQIQGNKTGLIRIKIKKFIKHKTGEITFKCKKLVRIKDDVYKVVENKLK